MLISDSLEAVVSEHTLNVGKENYHHEKRQAIVCFTRVQMEVAPTWLESICSIPEKSIFLGIASFKSSVVVNELELKTKKLVT